MNKKSFGLLLAVALVLILISGGMLYRYLAPKISAKRPRPGSSTESTSTAGNNSISDPNHAPDFFALDRQGKRVRLADINRDKPVVLNFWASWCPPCTEEMPYYQKAFTTYGDRISFMMVNLGAEKDTRADAENYLKEGAYTFPVYYDIDGEAQRLYGVSSIPVSIFLKPGGVLSDFTVGGLDEESLQSYLEALLK
jgi:thiol-disulfide isomerase/thioredoxin